MPYARRHSEPFILTVSSLQAANIKALPFGTDKGKAGAGNAESSALVTAEQDDVVRLNDEVSATCMTPVTGSSIH